MTKKQRAKLLQPANVLSGLLELVLGNSRPWTDITRAAIGELGLKKPQPPKSPKEPHKGKEEQFRRKDPEHQQRERERKQAAQKWDDYQANERQAYAVLWPAARLLYACSGEAYEAGRILDNASFRQSAYREAAKRTHPDTGGNPEVFQKVTEANELIREWQEAREQRKEAQQTT
jgi:hypothetical protein